MKTKMQVHFNIKKNICQSFTPIHYQSPQAGGFKSASTLQTLGIKEPLVTILEQCSRLDVFSLGVECSLLTLTFSMKLEVLSFATTTRMDRERKPKYS